MATHIQNHVSSPMDFSEGPSMGIVLGIILVVMLALMLFAFGSSGYQYLSTQGTNDPNNSQTVTPSQDVVR